MEKFFLVDEEFINSRFDRWFKKQVCEVPQSLIEKNTRKGNIKINNQKIKSSYRLKKSDKIQIKNFDFFANKLAHWTPRGHQADPSA